MLVPMLDEIIRERSIPETKEVDYWHGAPGTSQCDGTCAWSGLMPASWRSLLMPKQEERIPLTDSFGYGWTGDVKYHLGASMFWEKASQWTLRFCSRPIPAI